MKKNNIENAVFKQLSKERKCVLFEDDQVAIGTLLKKERIEKNLTQKEASDKTCSHSYLSKLESNKIKPNMDCVFKLFSKLDIDKSMIYLIENSGELLKDSYTFYYYQNKEGYADLFNKIKSVRHNQFASTIKLGYYLLNNDISKARRIVDDSSNITSTLTKTNLFIFSLYVSEFLYKDKKFKEALKIVEELVLKDVDHKLTIMAKEIYFKICVELDNIGIGASLYKELVDLYSTLSYYDKLDELKVGYLGLLFSQKEYKYILSIKDNYGIKENCPEIDKYNYIIGVSSLKCDFYNQARYYLERINKESIYYELSVFEREMITLMTSNKFIELVENDNREKPSFFLNYYLNVKNNTLDKSIFKSPEYNYLFHNSSNMIKKILLKYEIKFEEDNFKYKNAIQLYKKMEELSSIK